MKLNQLALAATSLLAATNHVLAETSDSSADSLLWGPYRSNLYMGVRPKGLPHSLMTGLMWFNIDDYQGLNKIRHACDMGDEMKGYGWEKYDPRAGGIQTFHDTEQKLELTTEFVKNAEGTNWGIRVKGVPKDGAKSTTIVFYAGLEGEGKLELENKHDKGDNGVSGDIKLGGRSSRLGSFDIVMSKGDNKFPKSDHALAKSRPAHKARHLSLNIPDDNVWMARDVFVTMMQDSIQKYYEKYSEDTELPPWVITSLEPIYQMKGNFHLIQRTFEGPFEFDILFNQRTKKAPRISSSNFNAGLEHALDVFEAKFESAFAFQPPFSDNPKKYGNFSRELFSNLIGGVGYFYGTSMVDRTYSEAYEEDEEGFWEAAAESLKKGIDLATEEGPFELLTTVPSRPFFPRGFYWDEGFNLIPILEYDADLSLEILKSWFALIDEDGWIAREQILGPEARSKVPKEFVTQYPHYANPPTLMLLLTDILEKFKAAQNDLSEEAFYNQQMEEEFEFEAGVGVAKSIFDNPSLLGTTHWKSPELLTSYLKEIYPELKLHYEWFRRTQKGSIRDWDREAFSPREGYRWRGRTPSHCLTSGLDDYPRADIPHTGELHVDLISWIGMMTRSMKQLAEFLDYKEDAKDFEEIETAIVRNIADLHWNPDEKAYCDLTVNEFGESEFACHKGYVSLFPFLLKLIPIEDTTEKLMPILELLSNPDELWTEYGIRSLSKSDKYYGTKENYWRGPIWMNINYMIVKSLQYYGEHPEATLEFRLEAARIYKALRVNLVNNVHKSWEETGFAWEQYNAETGKGQGVKHFLGWTSLTVMIMALPETIQTI